MQQNQNLSSAAGPGAVEDYGIAPKPLLEGATSFEVVTLFNPLTVDFVGMVGQDKPVNMPFQIRSDGVTSTVTTTEQDAARNYGLTLKNKDHSARLPITNKVIIPAGGTLNLFGNEAQVVVKQLVNEIMQRQGQKLLLADPFARHQVEKTIVRSRMSTQEAIGGISSVETQMKQGVDKLNEQAFPGLGASAEVDNSGAGSGDESKRRPGRPKSDAAGTQPATV